MNDLAIVKIEEEKKKKKEEKKKEKEAKSSNMVEFCDPTNQKTKDLIFFGGNLIAADGRFFLLKKNGCSETEKTPTTEKMEKFLSAILDETMQKKLFETIVLKKDIEDILRRGKIFIKGIEKCKGNPILEIAPYGGFLKTSFSNSEIGEGWIELQPKNLAYKKEFSGAKLNALFIEKFFNFMNANKIKEKDIEINYVILDLGSIYDPVEIWLFKMENFVFGVMPIIVSTI